MSAEIALPAATEQWRPRFHFTPRRNWINDPNGFVYYEGEYHLFYQYNPEGKEWGHMSWGHAVSRDLVQWTELPVAIPEKDYMIFSGCAVVDRNNTSGLRDGTSPPLIALYTAHHSGSKRQVQNLAYSHDKGRTWIDHPANPVIDRQMEHFRDPKVFWHEPSSAWIMTVALALSHKVAIYRSADLVDWQLASEFGPCGRTSGQWECPDLMELPVEGERRTIWMLKVDVDQDVIGSVSGAQVFFGTFDGTVFVPENEDGLLADRGADFYAAQSWSDLPERHEAPVWIAWMSNHQSGHDYPTHPWRGAMTLPRSVSARKRGGEWQLIQRPVDLRSARAAGDAAFTLDFDDGEPVVLAQDVGQLSGELAFTSGAQSRIVIAVGQTSETAIRIDIDGAHKRVTVERQARGWNAPDAFEEPMQACWAGDAPEVRLIFDRLSVEIFIPSEGVTLTACFFARPDLATTVAANGTGEAVRAIGFARS